MELSAAEYFKVIEGLLNLQRKSRLVSLSRGLGLEEAGCSITYRDGLVLHMLEAYPESTVKDLAQHLIIERSWASRMVSGLEERQLVQTLVPEHDKRSKVTSISRHGSKELKKLNEIRAAIVQRTLQELSQSDQQELCGYLTRFADGLGAPKIEAGAGSHPVDIALARIGWRAGTVGNDRWGSGLNVTQYQLLYVLAQEEGKVVSASELYNLLPFDMSTVSRTLAAFEKDGLITKKQSQEDKRSFAVTLNTAGRARWRKIQRSAAEIVERALFKFSPLEYQRFVDLLELGTRSMPVRQLNELPAGIVVQSLSDQASRTKVEKFIKELSRGLLNEGHNAEEPGNIEEFVVYADEEVQGVALLDRGGSKKEIRKFLFAGRGAFAGDCYGFIHTLLKRQEAK